MKCKTEKYTLFKTSILNGFVCLNIHLSNAISNIREANKDGELEKSLEFHYYHKLISQNRDAFRNSQVQPTWWVNLKILNAMPSTKRTNNPEERRYTILTFMKYNTCTKCTKIFRSLRGDVSEKLQPKCIKLFSYRYWFYSKEREENKVCFYIRKVTSN